MDGFLKTGKLGAGSSGSSGLKTKKKTDEDEKKTSKAPWVEK